ncbi:MAG: hypothetical protein IIA07_02340 [Proteobacteria bacterium]|nr:hypothetical protein [Pseudomonadota bacterium]
MTNERQHAETDGEADDLVSDTYRDLADEHTPDDLNKAILRQAARAVHPHYSRPASWTRPVAWAATIAISLAVMLQMVRVPTPESVISDMPPAPDRQEALEVNGSIDIYGAEPPPVGILAGGASKAASAMGSVRGCNDESREVPAIWLACISELEEAGLSDEAEQQREQLARAFPDFEMPRD